MIQNQVELALTFFSLIKLITRQCLCNFWQLRAKWIAIILLFSGFVNYLQVIFQNKWKKGIWKQQKHHQALSMFGYSTPLLWTLNREISWKGYIWNIYSPLPFIVNTVKSQAVDQSTIQFWTLLVKGHST